MTEVHKKYLKRVDKQIGVSGISYHTDRKTKKAPKYRLARRAYEVLDVIKKYKGNSIRSLLDIGTADGLMLDMLCRNLEILKPIGLDVSLELLKKNKNSKLNLIQGDALNLPFPSNTFDVVVATAVIEHVSDSDIILKECHRVLCYEGLCIITTPDPFFENIATKIGHLKRDEHVETFNLKKLRLLLKKHNFKIVKVEKFMMSPIGFPFELQLEKFIKIFELSFLLLNQLAVARKQGKEYQIEK